MGLLDLKYLIRVFKAAAPTYFYGLRHEYEQILLILPPFAS